jgi:hypothetical protein
MAQRLVTEYVHTRLVLTELAYTHLLELFQQSQRISELNINGIDNQELGFKVEQIPMTALIMTPCDGNYVLEGTCRCSDIQLANAIRKIISQFNGDTIARRIYETYTLEYVYQSGKVVLITEHSAHGERIIYTYSNETQEWMKRLQDLKVEQQIDKVRDEIDEWLDHRNGTEFVTEIELIDERLKQLSHTLFVLEA